jgi:bacillopeptidase F
MNLSNKRYAFVFLFIFFLCSFNAQAQVVSPKLRSLLNTLPGQLEIPVIVTLSDKANIHLIKDRDKRFRRSKIIRSLKDKADFTQGPLRLFLENRKAKKIKSLWLINGMAVTAKSDVIEELATLPGVEDIRLDGVITIPEVALEAGATPEWNISAIRAPELWNLGFTGQGIVVANMDSGVDMDHPDLGSKWRGGANSWFNPYSLPGNGGECAVPFQCTSCESSTTPCDDNGHGTGTMGVMVGGDAGGTALGVAPGAQWIGVKIFNGAGEAPHSVVHQGFAWLLDPDGDPDTDDAPDVVNNSWGLLNAVDQCIPEFETDIQTLKAAGIAVVFAGGNSGPNSFSSIPPANYPESFAAGAVDQFGQVGSSSSRGPSACGGSIYPQVVAPGVNIKLADLQLIPSPPAYVHLSGTSFAAPHVAGGMALLLSAHPDLAVSELELALKQSASDLGSFGPDNESGYGFLDVKKAYDLILNPAPDISVFPLSHQFSETKEANLSAPQTFTVVNSGSEDLMIGTVSFTGFNASEFIKQSDTCSGQAISPSQPCLVQVAFSPASGGPKDASLSIPSNDPDGNPLRVALSGTGIEKYLLNVARIGSGTGKVTSAGAEIDCGLDCQESLDPRTRMTLRATPDPESVVGHWSGCTFSYGTICSVTMVSDKNITATFVGPRLTVTSPNGGEEWKAGSFKKITWNFTGNPGSYLRIELLKGGILHSTVASRVMKGFRGKGTRYWRIPRDLPAGSDYSIQITSTTNGAHTDTSNDSFTVTP